MHFRKTAIALVTLGLVTHRLFAPAPPQPPTLSISVVTTNTVVISWPDSGVAGNFRLEQNPSPPPPTSGKTSPTFPSSSTARGASPYPPRTLPLSSAPSIEQDMVIHRGDAETPSPHCHLRSIAVESKKLLAINARLAQQTSQRSSL